MRQIDTWEIFSLINDRMRLLIDIVGKGRDPAAKRCDETIMQGTFDVLADAIDGWS